MTCINTEATQPVLPAEQWGELHGMLTLALEALGDKPEDFSPDFLANAVIHQRLAIRISHEALRQCGGRA